MQRNNYYGTKESFIEAKTSNEKMKEVSGGDSEYLLFSGPPAGEEQWSEN